MACGYEVSSQFSDVPSLVTHDEVQRTLSIYTESMDDIGTYTSQVSASIQVPLDYTLLEFKEMNIQKDITIVIGVTCETTVLDSFTVQDMEI
jgi:hypothetical protein